MKRILITGGFGYIGQVFLKLLNQKDEITILDNLSFNQDSQSILKKFPNCKFMHKKQKRNILEFSILIR